MDDEKLTDLDSLPSPPMSADLVYIVRDDTSYKVPFSQIVSSSGNVTSIATSTTAGQVPYFSDTSGKQVNASNATINAAGDGVLRGVSFGVDSTFSYPGLVLKHLTSSQLSSSSQMVIGSLVGDSSNFDRPKYYHSNGMGTSSDDLAYLSDINAAGFVKSNTVPSVDSQITVYDGTTGTQIKSGGFTASDIFSAKVRKISFLGPVTFPTISTGPVPFNTTIFGTLGSFDITSSTFTATEAGFYSIESSLYIEVTASAQTLLLGIYKNGAEYSYDRQDNFGDGQINSLTASNTVPLDVNDTITLYAVFSLPCILRADPVASWLNITFLGT